ncbi:MAG: protein-L-isoaspartate O-methyltransferase, partial [Nitrosopumilus sp.]|nr:protein-L-isoaspartate O-methyltransferase [Nitrosopumilus sp.]NNL37484.1 protein-L-isoaspartate O-methyltransferase [Nitrosopumilus sp.]
GTLGYPKEAPYDRIIITAACSQIPASLFDQLTENGLIIAPVGESSQSLVLLKKTSKGIIEIKNEPKYVFVPLVGKFGKK